jgi:hypothetical protein
MTAVLVYMFVQEASAAKEAAKMAQTQLAESQKVFIIMHVCIVWKGYTRALANHL